MISKTIHEPIEYSQDIAVRYLKPPAPAPHGDLIIRQENDVVRPIAPPQIIRIHLFIILYYSFYSTTKNGLNSIVTSL